VSLYVAPLQPRTPYQPSATRGYGRLPDGRLRGAQVAEP
jgi:hypothetical protein